MKNLKYNHPFIQRIADEAIDSLLIQKIEKVENLTQTYLTNNFLEKTMLEEMRNQLVTKPFNFIAKDLPILNELPYEILIEIRNKYSDEFKSFQNHISELFNKAHNFETQEEFNIFVKNELRKQLLDLKKI